MILQITALSKSYGSHRVLKDVSFEVQKSDVLCLCGESGAGKTTLVRSICGLTPFDSGEIQLGQTLVKALAPYPRDLFGMLQRAV